LQEEGKRHKPINYTERVLRGAEKMYQMIEKLTLALINSTRRLKPYFQSHQIKMKIGHPIKKVMEKLELARWMVA